MTRLGGALSLVSLIGALAALHPATAMADQVPVEFQGVWGQRCNDPASPQIRLEPDRVTVIMSGQRFTYAGVTASHTWFGGARASGKQVWLPVSKEPDGPFAFVLQPPQYGKRGVLTLDDEGHSDHGREVRSLKGAKFSLCDAAKSQSASGVSAAAPTRDSNIGPFIGKWTDAAGGLRYCNFNFDGYRISRTMIEDNDSRCRIRSVRKEADAYAAALSCNVEGRSSRATATLKAINDDRITINGAAYLRCK
jgi:hypothetical protein